MNKSSVVELKQEILHHQHEAQAGRLAAAFASMVDPRPENQLAIGYSADSTREYALELRVPLGNQIALQNARAIKETVAKGAANIEMISMVQIPPSAELLTDTAWGSFGDMNRPLHIGQSIGRPTLGAGTLGAFVQLPDGGVGILSNNHVLANLNRGTIGDPIYQPGLPDNDGLTDDAVIGYLDSYAELSETVDNFADAAIARLLPTIEHLSNYIPTGHGFPNEGTLISVVDDPIDLLDEPNKPVHKIGRTTGLTRGKVHAFSIDDLKISTQNGSFVFDDVIEIHWLGLDKPFSKAGDSGSLVYTADGAHALGLHFAAGVQTTTDGQQYGVSYCCNIQTVLAALDVTLLA